MPIIGAVGNRQSAAGIYPTAYCLLPTAVDGIGTKRPASRDRSRGAVRQTHHMREIERLTATNHSLAGMESEQIFSLQCHTEQAARLTRAANLYANDFFILSTPVSGKESMVEPDGIEPTTSCLQSRRSPS